MAAFHLQTLQDNAVFEIQSRVNKLDLSLEPEVFRDECQDICDAFLVLAAASLLSDYKKQLFFQNMYRAAVNWARFLETNTLVHKKPASLLYYAPLYAATVCREPRLLSDLIKLLPAKPRPGHGYPNRFHTCWLHLLLSAGHDASDAKVITHLDALEALDDTTLFDALLGRKDLEEADFWSAFDTALFERQAYVEEKVDNVALRVSEFAPHRYLWLEGITWLVLAKMKGFTLPSENIVFCPAEALDAPDITFPQDWLIVPVSEN